MEKKLIDTTGIITFFEKSEVLKKIEQYHELGYVAEVKLETYENMTGSEKLGYRVYIYKITQS